MVDKILEIFTDQIDDPENAMRSDMDRDELFELADNIKANGLINPITVRPRGDRYEVVAGHRRLCACKIAGLIRIQCVVRDLSDDQTFSVMAAENLERADVNLLDESIFITKYIESTGLTIPEVAKKLRRSVGYVESRIVIGSMPDYMQAHLKAGNLKLGVALALFQISEDKTRRVWVEMAVRDGVSVAQAEYWLHGWKVQQLPGGVDDPNPPTDFEPGVPSVVLFRCAIDGKEYDSRMFRTVMIYEKNIPIFEEIVKELNNPAE